VIVYHLFYERLNETSYPIRAFYPVYSLVRVGRSAKLSPAADESLYSRDFNRRVFSIIFNADLLSISHFSLHRWRSHQSKSTLKKLSAFNVSLVGGCYFEQTKRFCREQFFCISLHLYFLPGRCGRSPQLLTFVLSKVSQKKHSFYRPYSQTLVFR
jgi:hypothetical protein